MHTHPCMRMGAHTYTHTHTHTQTYKHTNRKSEILKEEKRSADRKEAKGYAIMTSSSLSVSHLDFRVGEVDAGGLKPSLGMTRTSPMSAIVRNSHIYLSLIHTIRA